MSGRVRRSAYVFLPLVVLLGVSAATLGIIYGLNAPQKQTTSGAYNRGNKWGATFGLPLVALYFIWKAGRWAEHHSTGAANGLFGGILALMNVGVGINAYRVTLGKPAPQPIAQRGPPVLGQSSPQPPPRPGPPAVPVHPSPQPVHSGDAPRPRPVPAAPAPAAGPSARELAEEKADTAARAVVEAFETRLMEGITLAADAAEGFAREVAKPPAHDKRVLRDRLGNADALRGALTKVEQELKNAADQLEKDLIAAGIDRSDARHRAVRAASEFGDSRRQFAAARLIDLCDRVKAECAALDEGFGAWTLAKGEISVRDPRHRHALTSERFFIEADVRTIGGTIQALREGR